MIHSIVFRARRSKATTQREPKIARCIGVGFDRQPGHLFAEEITGPSPRRREGHPLAAIIIAGQLTQFLQLGDRPLRLE